MRSGPSTAAPLEEWRRLPSTKSTSESAQGRARVHTHNSSKDSSAGHCKGRLQSTRAGRAHPREGVGSGGWKQPLLPGRNIQRLPQSSEGPALPCQGGRESAGTAGTTCGQDQRQKNKAQENQKASERSNGAGSPWAARRPSSGQQGAAARAAPTEGWGAPSFLFPALATAPDTGRPDGCTNTHQFLTLLGHTHTQGFPDAALHSSSACTLHTSTTQSLPGANGDEELSTGEEQRLWGHETLKNGKSTSRRKPLPNIKGVVKDTHK